MSEQTSTAITERPVRARCRIVLDDGLLFRMAGALVIGRPMRCELEHGHSGPHREGWHHWSGPYAKDPVKNGNDREARS